MANTLQSPSTEGDPGLSFAPSPEERVRYLSIAREAIRERIEKRRGQKPEPRSGEPRLGAFVTLNEDGRLRGCIGRMESREPLSLTIEAMAVAAAFEDPRFKPLSAGELDRISVEITLLGPRRKIATPEAIELGRHGVWLEQGYASAVFLPQVAVEQGWDRPTLLRELCRKAGLRADAWKDADCVLMVFEGFVFGDS
ncbi:MAG TPA: AmmeMemoRadiSam system protein A [Rectinemataceae bacterium]|nr:AmmeMemoRadiSam system protein A [Rectinemataceae bacterium]